MIKFEQRGRILFEYDIKERTLARQLTKSNVKEVGSDNSLYFGMVSNDDVVKILVKIFDVKDISEVNQRELTMSFYSENIDILLNINAQGQIQIKMMKNGLLHKMFNRFVYEEMEERNPEEIEIVFDMSNKKICFSDVG